VKPFVKSNRNDFVDAEAVAEAVERKNMRFVQIKTDDKLWNLQAIHGVRDRLISRRTAVINQLRAFLLERGMVFAQKLAKLKAAMADILENAEADLTPEMRNLIDRLWGEWKLVETQIEELNDDLERISAADAGCTRIRQIPGIALLSPQPSWLPSATAPHFARHGTSLRSSGSYHASIRPVVRRSCSAMKQ
jgi:transposase